MEKKQEKSVPKPDFIVELKKQEGIYAEKLKERNDIERALNQKEIELVKLQGILEFLKNYGQVEG